MKKIDDKKARLDTFRPFPAHVIQSIQESLCVEWTYNSNSIEGNTLTLQKTRTVLQEGLTVGGKSLRDHYEVVNHNDAIEFVENLVKPSYVLRELDILSVHQLVMDKLDKEFSGRIRNAGVRIPGANFTTPNALKVSDLRTELISWVRKEGNGLHPIIRAALFHHRLVWIHLFFDGNGRTARLGI